MIDKEKINYFAGYLFSTKLTCMQYEQVITEWLEQNPIEPVVVGLSDEQVDDLASDLDSWNIGDTDGFIFHIKEWLKSQTFAQQSAFTPNWDDAPKNTHYARFQIEWLNKMYHQIGVSVLSQQERPKPTQVEVGQIWKDKKEIDEITIVALGKNKIYEMICYQFTESRVIEIRCNADFLAKFDRVGDRE